MHPKIRTRIMEVHFICHGQRENKKEICEKRKTGKPYKNYQRVSYQQGNMEHLIRLIERHGNPVLRKDKNSIIRRNEKKNYSRVYFDIDQWSF